jgi:phosphatidylserine/phosphatidylglycerophosphate/cardiolipin synthase-like enzyme
MATLATIIIAFAGGYLAGVHGAPTRVTAQNLAPAHTACNFCPEGKCLEAVADELLAAQHSIEIEGRSLTSTSVADALLSAKSRGVQVTLLLDAAQTSEHREHARRLVKAGIPVYLDARHAVADNRVILIDERIVITGSFSFTESSAPQNAGNLLILHDQPQLQSSYENDFRLHVRHSQPYDGN